MYNDVEREMYDWVSVYEGYLKGSASWKMTPLFYCRFAPNFVISFMNMHVIERSAISEKLAKICTTVDAPLHFSLITVWKWYRLLCLDHISPHSAPPPSLLQIINIVWSRICSTPYQGQAKICGHAVVHHFLRSK